MTSLRMTAYTAAANTTVHNPNSFIYSLVSGETLTVNAGVLLRTTGSNSPVAWLQSKDVIINNGTLKGSAGAIVSSGSGNTIHNTGSISNDLRHNFAAIHLSGHDGTNNILNTGRIKASFTDYGKTLTATAFWSIGEVSDVFINKGLIEGYVLLGGGNDLFDSRAGQHSGAFGEGGNDTLLGGRRDDYFKGGAGRDNLVGGAGCDQLRGGTDADILTGGSGNDFLTGGAGSDTLIGSSGDDILTGGAATDILMGGTGRDAFIFDTKAGSSNIDQIRSFSAKDDMIGWSHKVFPKTFLQPHQWPILHQRR